MMFRIPDLTLPRISGSTKQTHITFKVLTTINIKIYFRPYLGLRGNFHAHPCVTAHDNYND